MEPKRKWFDSWQQTGAATWRMNSTGHRKAPAGLEGHRQEAREKYRSSTMNGGDPGCEENVAILKR